MIYEERFQSAPSREASNAVLTTKIPMLKTRPRMSLCLRGMFSFVIMGMGMRRMPMSLERLKQAWTIA